MYSIKNTPIRIFKRFLWRKKVAEQNLPKNINKILQCVSSLSGDDQEKVLQFLENLGKTKNANREV